MVTAVAFLTKTIRCQLLPQGMRKMLKENSMSVQAIALGTALIGKQKNEVCKFKTIYSKNKNSLTRSQYYILLYMQCPNGSIII